MRETGGKKRDPISAAGLMPLPSHRPPLLPSFVSCSIPGSLLLRRCCNDQSPGNTQPTSEKRLRYKKRQRRRHWIRRRREGDEKTSHDEKRGIIRRDCSAFPKVRRSDCRHLLLLFCLEIIAWLQSVILSPSSLPLTMVRRASPNDIFCAEIVP